MGGVFLWCGSLPFSGAVLVSLRPLSVCHGSYWLVTALFISSRVPYLRDGATPVGSRIVCPRSERRFSVPVWVWYTGHFMVGPHASVCGISARPVRLGVLPGGPRCVRELRLSLAPSSVHISNEGVREFYTFCMCPRITILASNTGPS